MSVLWNGGAALTGYMGSALEKAHLIYGGPIRLVDRKFS